MPVSRANSYDNLTMEGVTGQCTVLVPASLERLHSCLNSIGCSSCLVFMLF